MNREDTRLPLKKFEDMITKRFNKSNLTEEAQKVYESILETKQHLGDPVSLVNEMFSKFENKDHTDLLLFSERLKAIDQELDLCIAAKMAMLIV
jgi:superfamily II RNA helicase